VSAIGLDNSLERILIIERQDVSSSEAMGLANDAFLACSLGRITTDTGGATSTSNQSTGEASSGDDAEEGDPFSANKVFRTSGKSKLS